MTQIISTADERRCAPTVLSCFSGAGGLDLGLEAAGFRTVGLLETNSAARATLRVNRPRWIQLEPHDVVKAGMELQPKSVGMRARQLDLIAGGPPCQPFSKAGQWVTGQRAGISDDRGRAVFGMLDLVQKFRPRALLLENVAGFLEGNVSVSGVVSDRLTEINSAYGTKYRLAWFVVDAAHYGVPQHRMRVLATAFRDGTLLTEPPGPTHVDHPITAWDALSTITPAVLPVATGKWAELLQCIPEGENYLHLTARGAGPELFGYRTRYWSFLLKLARDRPSWTLPASPGPSTGPFHWDNRPLAPEERLALQGFPPDWQLVGQSSAQVRLAGNATPPPLAEAVGRQIRSLLQRDSTLLNAPPQLIPKRAETSPTASPVAALPSRFASFVGPQDAHPGEGVGPGRKAASTALEGRPRT